MTNNPEPTRFGAVDGDNSHSTGRCRCIMNKTMAYIDKLDLLKEIEQELKRFQAKIDLAIKEQSKTGNYSNKNYAAAKRAALDLKNELTKLTQDSKYRYSKLN